MPIAGLASRTDVPRGAISGYIVPYGTFPKHCCTYEARKNGNGNGNYQYKNNLRLKKEFQEIN